MGVDNLRGARQPDWDGCGARSLTDDAIRSAEAIEAALSYVPCVDGGFQVEFHAAGVDCELRFGPDGKFDGSYVERVPDV